MYVKQVTGSQYILNLLKNHRSLVVFLALQTSASHPQCLALIKAEEASRKFEIRLIPLKVGPCGRPRPQYAVESRGAGFGSPQSVRVTVSPDAALGCPRGAACVVSLLPSAVPRRYLWHQVWTCPPRAQKLVSGWWLWIVATSWVETKVK